MGTGWSYFINVCQAVRVAVAAAWTVVGLIVVYLVITVGLPQLQSALPASAPSSTTPAGTEANPQFASPPVSSPRASAPRGMAGVNPQFGSPAAQPPPGSLPGVNSQPINSQPANSQFTPAAPRSRSGRGGFSSSQPNPQFKNPQFGH